MQRWADTCAQVFVVYCGGWRNVKTGEAAAAAAGSAASRLERRRPGRKELTGVIFKKTCFLFLKDLFCCPWGDDLLLLLSVLHFHYGYCCLFNAPNADACFGPSLFLWVSLLCSAPAFLQSASFGSVFLHVGPESPLCKSSFSSGTFLIEPWKSLVWPDSCL